MTEPHLIEPAPSSSPEPLTITLPDGSIATGLADWEGFASVADYVAALIERDRVRIREGLKQTVQDAKDGKLPTADEVVARLRAEYDLPPGLPPEHESVTPPPTPSEPLSAGT